MARYAAHLLFQISAAQRCVTTTMNISHIEVVTATREYRSVSSVALRICGIAIPSKRGVSGDFCCELVVVPAA
ncbi:hypothetical protein F5883DRAFT_60205 [Diaporthe sp. PMI_573]|nr:hypothetical protein F5883DRAFT_60205 [Diaporthaceae sp. PMI_573]